MLSVLTRTGVSRQICPGGLYAPTLTKPSTTLSLPSIRACLRSRDGHTLQQAKGKAYLRNAEWRKQMDTIVDLLRAIRSRYELGKRLGTIHSFGQGFHCINDSRTGRLDGSDQRRNTPNILDVSHPKRKLVCPIGRFGDCTTSVTDAQGSRVA